MEKTFAYILLLVIGIQLGFSFSGTKVADMFGGTSTPYSTASTTVFTLTTTSQRILATSTRRTAFAVQPTLCTSNTSIVYVTPKQDVPSTSSNGVGVHSTTTEKFIDNFGLPVSEDSVTAITNAGTCTVVVTEWRESI